MSHNAANGIHHVILAIYNGLVTFMLTRLTGEFLFCSVVLICTLLLHLDYYEPIEQNQTKTK